LPSARERANPFLAIVTQRSSAYKKGMMILTSNLTFGSQDWAFPGNAGGRVNYHC
jgi:hypothetical protein